MVLPLQALVPEEYDYWYYHEPSKIVLCNDSEYGWVACSRFDVVEQEAKELREALLDALESGVLDHDEREYPPFPDDYPHTNREGYW